MRLLEYLRRCRPGRLRPPAPPLPEARAPASSALPDVLRWARSFDVLARPWLVLGKGPSYAELERFDRSGFHTCSLNHAVRELPVDLAHLIDLEVVDEVGEALRKNARFVALPFFPHRGHRPEGRLLDEVARDVPILRALAEEGRLFGYNLSSAPRLVSGSPLITARFFSAEAVVNLLAACGVKTIRSLGVDGGQSYAAQYRDLEEKTCLANGHASFDLQFEEIARAIRTRGLFYAPLHKEAPIRVFVGTDASQTLAVRVLEYSIKKHAAMSVEVTPLLGVQAPVPRDPRNRPRTGFSFARFAIPSLCGYRGKAIYLDADMLVFQDIARLWDFPLGGADVLYAGEPPQPGRARQFSVLLLNCANLPWKLEEIVAGLDDGRYDYRGLMTDLCIVEERRVSGAVPAEWNSLEVYRRGRTCLLHYTDMHRQPWVSRRNRHRSLWYQALREALEEGFIAPEEVYGEVEHGHVMPVLPRKVGLAPHPEEGRLRQSFVPPYRRLLS